jgi:hypothetical protein
VQDEISNFPENTKFKNLIATHKDKSGDFFIKKLLTKCLDMSISSTLSSASDKDISDMISKERHMMCGQTSSVNHTNYKIFVGKMINNVYEYKYNPDILDEIDFDDIKDYNIIYDGVAFEVFRIDILAMIKKESLLKIVVDYMNTLQVNDLNSGKKLFSLLVNVFYKMYENEKNITLQNVLNEKEKLILNIRKVYEGMNTIFEYESKFYDTDSSSDDDGDDKVELHDDTTKLVDYSSSDSESSNTEPKLSNKRKSSDNYSDSDKKRKID